MIRWGACAWSASVLALACGTANAAPKACAIRWDAWYTNGPHDPGAFTAAALSVPAWRDRTPLHAHFDESGRIVWAPSQETFDVEIRAAAKANLCWVYLAYGDRGVIDLGHPMMRGLWFHRHSTLRSEVDYALMTTPALLAGSDRKRALAATLQFLEDENYQRVTVGEASRPLLFLYVEGAEAERLLANPQPLHESIAELRAASRVRGLGDPYVVATLSGATSAESVRSAIGADAISQYVAGRRRGRQSWAQFEPSIEADWDLYAAATAADVVPTLRTGADIRARCQTPPPFEHRFPAGSLCDDFVFNPTIEELKQEFRHARAWIDMRRARDPAALMLVYSWSECDESGNCLMPTYGDPTGRKLDVIERALTR